MFWIAKVLIFIELSKPQFCIRIQLSLKNCFRCSFIAWYKIEPIVMHNHCFIRSPRSVPFIPYNWKRCRCMMFCSSRMTFGFIRMFCLLRPSELKEIVEICLNLKLTSCHSLDAKLGHAFISFTSCHIFGFLAVYNYKIEPPVQQQGQAYIKIAGHTLLTMSQFLIA